MPRDQVSSDRRPRSILRRSHPGLKAPISSAKAFGSIAEIETSELKQMSYATLMDLQVRSSNNANRATVGPYLHPDI
ncbi:hypothetical protein FH972_023156 [Carpinus fangiana]|uniref:Uncharacterized protein n=1 Tax=Carpinus fangiana TaxID=176857 RepID=A0A5N6KUZ4_9ROSI|nr:hypothetical protein FH972_023156 [Carpinus fangiana]